MDFRLSRDSRVLRICFFPPIDDRFSVDSDVVHAHLSQFWYLYQRFGPQRIATQFIRSRDDRQAAHIIFKYLDLLGSGGNENYLAESLLDLWGQERRGSVPFTWRTNLSTVHVFEAMCALLRSSCFDCSRDLYLQLAFFLSECFDELASEDPQWSAMCLVALDQLRREMRTVIEKIARTSQFLEEVVREEQPTLDLLTNETKQDLVRCLDVGPWETYGGRHLDRIYRRSRHRGYGLPSALGRQRLCLSSAIGDGNRLQLNLKEERPRSSSLALDRPRLRLLQGPASHRLLDYDNDSADDFSRLFPSSRRQLAW